ncbi:hypothetical protein IPA_06180 [Ignicoccus pacificus DSM 13166]|uniref:Dinitrogenase iron-molybdenum cofactor biosynthesis domain-containing protein n=1 Tax=Ignicoccus pacificus DSM 13166 TaxID=940294 RepID=A0A977KBC5_9CREN|nr:hypothetical protein IPA_06180 [Ignicoccus pacificus DSM 13166]
MKVAIVCECLKGQCKVAHHFGLAPLVCIFEDGKEAERTLNPAIKMERRRGRTLAEFLASKGVEVVVGPPLQGHGGRDWVTELGMRYIEKEPGTPVEEVLKELFS